MHYNFSFGYRLAVGTMV